MPSHLSPRSDYSGNSISASIEDPELVTVSSERRRVIRIFICSSGDMAAERRLAAQVVHDVQRECEGEAALEVYLWEDNLHRMRTGVDWQLNIPLPQTFDIVLGFVHSRIGKKLTAEAYSLPPIRWLKCKT